MKRFIAVQVLFLLFNAVVIFLVGRGIERKLQEGDKTVIAAVRKTVPEVKRSVDAAGAGNAADLEEIKKLGKEIADRLAAAVPSGRSLPADTLTDEAPAEVPDGNDYRIQTLMEEGAGFYGDKDYGRAAAAFKKILGYDGENRRALVYYCASVFKLNPGDETETGKLKKILEPLTVEGQLEGRDRYTAIEVLQGISVEEGDSAAAQKYAWLLKKMEAES